MGEAYGAKETGTGVLSLPARAPGFGLQMPWGGLFLGRQQWVPSPPPPVPPYFPVLSFSPWSVLMWAPESISADPLPFLLLLPTPPFCSPSGPFMGWSIPLILAPSPNPPPLDPRPAVAIVRWKGKGETRRKERGGGGPPVPRPPFKARLDTRMGPWTNHPWGP